MKKTIIRIGQAKLLSLAMLLALGGLVSTGRQAGAACTYTNSVTSQAFSFGPSNGTVSVTTSNTCTWTVDNTNSWISITSPTNYTNNGIVLYTVATNPVTLARTGSMTIASQLFKVTQSAAPCTYAFSTTRRTNGYSATTGTVSVVTSGNCGPWTVVNTNTSWLFLVSGSSGTGSNLLTYRLTTNSVLPQRTSTLNIQVGGQNQGQSLLIAQLGIPCNFSISPAIKTNGYGATTASVNLTSISNQCAWTVVNTNNWMHLTSPTSGTGTSNNVTFTIDANPSSIDRTGLMLIADQVFTEKQSGAPCVYNLSTTSRNHGYTGTTNATNMVLAPIACNWTVSNPNDWITVTPMSGSGTTLLSYAVATNLIGLPRTGFVAIASVLFTISQNPAPCTFTLAPTSGSHLSAMQTGLVSVTTLTGCPWAVSTTNGWITIQSSTSNTGTGSVSYVVAANPSSLARTGSISIESKTFVVSQQGSGCSYKLSATTRTHGYTGASATVTNTTTSNCSWTASPNVGWITITSGASGMGTSNINYTVDPNPTPSERTGLVMIADQILTVIEHGFPCTFSISPNNSSRGHGATNGTVILTASSNLCPWVVVNTNSWITITPPTSGTGNTTVAYAVDANPTAFDRTGLVLIGDQTFTLVQHGITCSFSLSPMVKTNGNGATTVSVLLNASSNACPWALSTSNFWIHLLTDTNGFGDTNVTFAIDSNPSSIPRTGFVSMAEQVFTEVQRGAPCNYSITPTNRNHGAGGTATAMVSVSAAGDCPWTISNTNSWITITNLAGNGPGTVYYAVDPNPSTLSRTGVVVIASQILTLSQTGAVCSVTLTPDSQVYGSGAVSDAVAVSIPSGCPWTASTTNSWISLTGVTSGNGPGSVPYTLTPNIGASSRAGSIIFGTNLFVINQLGTNCDYFLSPPTGRAHGYAATSGTIKVTTDSNCAWSVSTTNVWIALNPPLSGTGTGVVSYALQTNPTLNDRLGFLFVGGQTFIVTQHVYACTYAVSPSSHSHGYTASGGSVSLNCNSNICPWSVVNTSPWIHITSPLSGTGDTNVTYTVDKNTSIDARTGLVMIADQILTLTQDGLPCNFKLSPGSTSRGFGPTNGTVSLTSSTNVCGWTVVNTNSWISITNTSGTGNVAIGYSITANFNADARTGVVMIADQLFTLTQRGLSNLAFSATALLPGGQVHLTLIGGPFGIWNVQASADLIHWTNIVTLTNTTGRMEFTNTVPAGVTNRFYRAVQPPGTAATNGSSTLQADPPAGGHIKLTLLGGSNGIWQLQTSSDLKQWVPVTTLTNSTGSVDYLDTAPATPTNRFYRALQQ